jgi:hypothetical protein
MIHYPEVILGYNVRTESKDMMPVNAKPSIEVRVTELVGCVPGLWLFFRYGRSNLAGAFNKVSFIKSQAS